MSFADGFLGIQARAAKDNPSKAFDWDKAAQIIKEKYAEHPDLVAEAGLNGDWDCTYGVIFAGGKPKTDGGMYLASNWATPLLNLKWNDQEEEIECSADETDRFNCHSTWDEGSLAILEIKPE
jgi:hypothetical protein